MISEKLTDVEQRVLDILAPGGLHAMRNSVPAAPDPSLPELRRALEAMREAGWLISAPTTPAAEVSEPRAPAPGLNEESR